MARLREKKTGAQRVCVVFVVKKLMLFLEKAQPFKINIPDLFVFIRLINEFWMENIRFFFGLVCLQALLLPVQ